MKTKVVFVGSGAKLSIITVDFADAEEALAMARRVAEQTGRTVTSVMSTATYWIRLKWPLGTKERVTRRPTDRTLRCG
jgi:hypothetical protein